MYPTDLTKLKELSKAAAAIEPLYINALLRLTKALAKERVDWALGGELGEALRTVNVKPDCIEIYTSKRGAAKIFLAIKEHDHRGLFFQIQQLPRKAEIDGKQYPVYVRSYYFEFPYAGVRVKVHGDIQYKVGDWEWGGIVAFNPEYIYIVGVRTAIVPLQVKYELYRELGWADRAEKVSQVLARRAHVQVTN
jgi:mRNA-degrading endonuclease YafQ of YafQ-DinJ toxin-antitoxin module